MTPSELKRNYEARTPNPLFFKPSVMRFFGDTMRNYGVVAGMVGEVSVWVLFRRRAVKHGLKSVHSFRQDTFEPIVGEPAW